MATRIPASVRGREELRGADRAGGAALRRRRLRRPLFGRAKEPLLRRRLRLEGGIPSHDILSRIFRPLAPRGWLPAPASVVGAEHRAFEASFGRFVAAFVRRAGSGAIVAIDGKTARRSFDRQRGRRPLDLVSAWAVEQRVVLGQEKAAGDSNEIEALPAWPPGWEPGRPSPLPASMRTPGLPR